MKMFARALLAGVLTAGLLAAAPVSDARAASTSTSSDAAPAAGGRDAFVAGQNAVEQGEWKLAVQYLRRAVAGNPDDADGFNLLAYSYRQLGRLDAAFENYDEALRLDPNHRGAHEYIGEAYLMIDDLESAERHLSQLQTICGGSCPEAEELADAIARYRESGEAEAADGGW